MQSARDGGEPPIDPKHAAVYRPDGEGPFALLDAGAVLDAPGTWRSMIDLMKSDAAQLRVEYPGESIWLRFFPVLMTSWSYRLSHTLRRRGHRVSPIAVMWTCFFFTGAQISPNAVIGPGFLCTHPQTVIIGGGVMMGRNCKLLGVNTLGAVWRDSATRPEIVPGSPRLGDGVLFGSHSCAFGPILIGDRVEVGACSLVLHDCPEGAVVKGSPAR